MTDNPRAFGKKKTGVPSGTMDFSAVWLHSRELSHRRSGNSRSSQRHVALHFQSMLKPKTLLNMSGWWFGTCFFFPYIGNVIIPTDEVILFRGIETTNQLNMFFFPQHETNDTWISMISIVYPSYLRKTNGPACARGFKGSTNGSRMPWKGWAWLGKETEPTELWQLDLESSPDKMGVPSTNLIGGKPIG